MGNRGCAPHATRECLRLLARHLGSSNTQIARGVAVEHASQISRLLGTLAEAGLASKRSLGAGKRNVW